jgi:AcrR family transcriptional regulator
VSANAVQPASLPGRRESKKAITRSELLLAARHLFSAKGLYDSTIEDLTLRAGVAKGTLYGYFQSKEELVLAVVADGFHELDLAVARRMRGARDLDDRVARAVDAHFRFYFEHPDFMKILHQARGMLKFHGRDRRPLRGVLVTYLERLSGRLADGVPSARWLDAGKLVFGSTSGIMSVWTAADRGAAVHRAPPSIVEAVATMIAARVRR